MSSKRTQRQFSVEEVGKNIVAVHPNVISRFLDSGELGYYKRLYDLSFRKPGTYWFNAYLDGEIAGRYPLVIEYAPISNS